MRRPRIALATALAAVSTTLGCLFQMPPDPAKVEAITVLADPEPRELAGLKDLGRVETFVYTRGLDDEAAMALIMSRLKGSALRAFRDTTHLYMVEIHPGDTEYAFTAFGLAAGPSMQ